MPSDCKGLLLGSVMLFCLIATGVPFSPALTNVVAAGPGRQMNTMSGAPQGIPSLCQDPNVTTTASGMWSNPAIWSTHRVPGQKDRVRISKGHSVTYDVVSDAAISCIDVHGQMLFKNGVNTRLEVTSLTIFEDGYLEIGDTANPILPDVHAEIIIANQLIDTSVDPAQFGNGIICAGKVVIHGARKTPTFLRLAREARAGDRTLYVESRISGWLPGDEVVIPDTRQLRPSEKDNYQSRDERIPIESITGSQIRLARRLLYDHEGARSARGNLMVLPHIGNVTRNVVVRSENPNGVRGHMMFIGHADVDIRYAEVLDMGRTKVGLLENSEFDDRGKAVWIGANQIGRYPIHFHYDFGPRKPTANGYQFTLIGNSVVSTPKWGIVVHESSYGLIRDNIVYDSRGAGITTEDGSESFNVFDHNFSLRSRGSGKFAAPSGYAGATPDPGGEGGGFWFRGPNNYIRNNVSASGDAFGFGIAAGPLGMIRIPKFKGGDPSVESESVALDTESAGILQFQNNEAYGVMETGVQCGWGGKISNLTVWHASRYGLTGSPTNQLEIENVTVIADVSILGDAGDHFTDSTGLWFAKYPSKSVIVRDANVQGFRTGVASSLFFTDDTSLQSGTEVGSFVVENSRLNTEIGVAAATAYAQTGQTAQVTPHAVIRDLHFQPLAVNDGSTPEAISANDLPPSGDARQREPIYVYDFEGESGDDFDLFYSNGAPESVAPCHNSRPGIAGWACKP